jgi:hypothetical protein
MKWVLVAVALLAGCAPEDGPLMAPGQDCLECHTGGEANRWTAAGTWVRGARITVTDANGKTVPMRGNDVGNFYTAESLTPPLTVSVDGRTMPADALQTTLWPAAKNNYGGCNLCHRGARKIENWELEAPLMAPGRDCVACHNGSAALKFTVAGTWLKDTGDVTVTDSDSPPNSVVMQRNAAGNFYTDAPLVFPLTGVWIGAEKKMDADEFRGAMHGSCNRCHGRGEDED